MIIKSLERGENFVTFCKVILAILISILIIILFIKIVVEMFYNFSSNLSFPTEKIEEILGEILLVFVLIELLRCVLVFVTKKDIYIIALYEAALIAVLRETIILGVKKVSPLYILAISVLIFTLSYFYFSKSEWTQK